VRRYNAEAYENVPAGKCKQLVSQMAYMFYVSWLMFPTLFLLGPEVGRLYKLNESSLPVAQKRLVSTLEDKNISKRLCLELVSTRLLSNNCHLSSPGPTTLK
jgi:hypothetical protein